MRAYLAAVTLAAACLLPQQSAPVAAQDHTADASAGETILAVLAHPDDELVFAPMLAAAARQGANVRLLFVTSGDAGPGVSQFEPGEALAEARRAEAMCSASALGAEAQFLSGYGDGTLTQTPRAPGSPAKRLLDELSGTLAAQSPDLVITWGPDGGYGHGDHRMVSAIVTQVVQAAPAERRPRLLYPAMVHDPLPEVLQRQGWTLTAPELANASYPYDEADLAAAGSATQCHETQFDEATRGFLAPGFHAMVWKGEVRFRPAFAP